MLERMDSVMDCHKAPDSVEAIYNARGDIVTYRVYDDGTVTERQQQSK